MAELEICSKWETLPAFLSTKEEGLAQVTRGSMESGPKRNHFVQFMSITSHGGRAWASPHVHKLCGKGMWNP